MDYLILSFIGGVLLFGILYFLPLKLKPLHKLVYVMIALIFSNLFLFINPFLGIGQTALITTLLILLVSYFISKKINFETASNGGQELENMKQTKTEEKLDAVINEPKSEKFAENVNSELAIQKASLEAENKLDALEFSNVTKQEKDSMEEIEILSAMEEKSEQIVETIEEDTPFSEIEVLEELSVEASSEEVHEVEIQPEQQEGQLEDFNEDEEVFFNRQVSATTEEEIGVALEENPANEANVITRENLFAELDDTHGVEDNNLTELEESVQVAKEDDQVDGKIFDEIEVENSVDDITSSLEELTEESTTIDTDILSQELNDEEILYENLLEELDREIEQEKDEEVLSNEEEIVEALVDLEELEVLEELEDISEINVLEEEALPEEPIIEKEEQLANEHLDKLEDLEDLEVLEELEDVSEANVLEEEGLLEEPLIESEESLIDDLEELGSELEDQVVHEKLENEDTTGSDEHQHQVEEDQLDEVTEVELEDDVSFTTEIEDVLKDNSEVTLVSEEEHSVIEDLLVEESASATVDVEGMNDQPSTDFTEEKDVVSQPQVRKPRMNRDMRDIFIEQLKWTKGNVSIASYEDLLKQYVQEDLDDQDYYIFSGMLRDHYVETEQFVKLEQLIISLRGRFSNNPILMEELAYFEKKFL